MLSKMSDYKKRHVERKGIKKQEEVDKKLIEENLDDLKTSKRPHKSENVK